jgi:hypothetical protein
MRSALFDKVDRLTLDRLPRTLLLLGDYGCGKHTLVKYISERFNLVVENITENISSELIDNISQRTSPSLYVIEGMKLTLRDENILLKFLEEPLKNAFIVILSESKQSILPTVLNRCQVWNFESYDSVYLNSLINTNCNRELLLSIANTPGKILEYQQYPIEDMFNLADKIFLNIHRANFANTLSLSRYLAFKNEKDKYNVSLFIDILLECCRKLIIEGKLADYGVYKLTSKLNNNKLIFNIDKKALFEHYLIELKEICG